MRDASGSPRWSGLSVGGGVIGFAANPRCQIPGRTSFCCDSAAFYEDICREASNAAAFGMVVHETHGAVKTKQEDLFLHYARDIPAGNRIDFERAI